MRASPGPQEAIAPPAPLVVAVHGWMLSGRLWEPLRPYLDPPWSLWCPDLPGFGECPRPTDLQPSLASYGRWLAAAAQGQARGRPIVLMGHSLGGSVALHAAPLLGLQLAAMVQIGSGGGVYQPRPFARLRRGGAALLQLRPRWLGPWVAESPWRGPLMAETRAARGLLATSTRRGAVQQLPMLTAALTVPSLWIVGERDRVMEPRYVRHLASFAPDHRLELIAKGGHLPMCERPEVLAELLLGWFAAIGLSPEPGGEPLGWADTGRRT
jgi:2-succinyl-6-hydroxy-2,4-cyclohexadiene-1-carboxylate synthase